MDAIQLAQRLVQLEPRNPLFALEHGWAYYFAGEYESAVTVYQEAIALDPVDSEPYFRLAQLELSRGNLAQALEHARFSEQLAGDTINRAGIVAEYVYIYAKTGALEDATRIADRLPSNAFPQALATVQLALGNDEQALATLQTDAERIEANNLEALAQPTYAFIIWNTYNDPILNRPEFMEVRKRLGFRE
jgi:tetratricopeptide (TPR) repeat protein